MTEQNIVQWVYSSKDIGELRARYDQWASAYEHDLEKDFGWSGPQLAVDVFIRYVPTGARVLDAGAGTGLVGRALKENGYSSIVAMDSPKACWPRQGRPKRTRATTRWLWVSPWHTRPTALTLL